jgi:hypothetical protein
VCCSFAVQAYLRSSTALHTQPSVWVVLQALAHWSNNLPVLLRQVPAVTSARSPSPLHCRHLYLLSSTCSNDSAATAALGACCAEGGAVGGAAAAAAAAAGAGSSHGAQDPRGAGPPRRSPNHNALSGKQGPVATAAVTSAYIRLSSELGAGRGCTAPSQQHSSALKCTAACAVITAGAGCNALRSAPAVAVYSSVCSVILLHNSMVNRAMVPLRWSWRMPRSTDVYTGCFYRSCIASGCPVTATAVHSS